MRTIVLMMALAPLALAADAEPDAKLAGKLTVKDLQGGFAGFTGKVYTLDTDGSYTVGNEFRGKVTQTAKGKLDAKTLAKVAAAVKKYAAATLKDTGKPGTNPRVVTVAYNKNTASLNLPTTGALPAADEKDAAGRFAGIVTALLDAIPKEKPRGVEK